MKAISIVLSLYIILITTQVNAQSQINFGFVSLKIQYRGNFTEDALPTFVNYGNILKNETPGNFTKINDSTYFFNEISAGPTGITFRINNEYFSTLLYPDEIDSITVLFKDNQPVTTTYSGRSKQIFDSSKIQLEILGSLIGTHNSKRNPIRNSPLQKAEDLIVYEEANMNDFLYSSHLETQPANLRNYYTNIIQAYFVTAPLFKDYHAKAYAYNIRRGMDSINAQNAIPNKNTTYYEALFQKMIRESGDLTNPIGTAVVIDLILKNEDFNLPSQEKYTAGQLLTHYSNYINKLDIQQKNRWIELLTAKRLCQQINIGNWLSESDKACIAEFEKKGLSNYIRALDIIKQKEEPTQTSKQRLLPYPKEQKNVLEKVLSEFKNKVVIIDFWATWCGPCIEAFSQMETIKKKYADNPEIVFVYITDETSNRDAWKNFVKTIGGVHYYIYKEQSDEIHKNHGIQSIPSYLIFDRNGKLAEQNPNGFPGIEVLTQKIERSLGN